MNDVVIITLIVIAVISLFGYCIISATGEDEEEQRKEDEEQMEYLRKWREEHEQIH